MSGDELDEIRQQRREQRERELADEPASDGATPDEPIRVDGGEEFETVIGDHDVVLVDFYADWCGPCKMLEPVVENLAAETQAAVAKVDVDANQGLAGEYGVRGVPTLLLFADGEAVERVVGVRDESHFRDLVERHAA